MDVLSKRLLLHIGIVLGVCIGSDASGQTKGEVSKSCTVVHGRAHFYAGDGRLRIWHIGTHHEFEPDDSSSTRVEKWLEDGVNDAEKSKSATPASMLCLFADFLICPVESFKKGSAQLARVKSASHKHYVDVGQPGCFEKK